MATDDFSDIQVLKSAKYLARMALQPILGHKPLRSREFFQPLNKPIAIAVEPLND
jgi:DNA repair protein RecO (recombination protein O)